MTAPNGRTAIVVVPRERYSPTCESLEHLYAHTRGDFRVIVVDAGSPPEHEEPLRALARDLPDCEIVRAERPMLPYAARNLALKHLRDDDANVVIMDNDVRVSPGWLTALRAAADETGARLVHPVYLAEQRGRAVIHMARGRYDDQDGVVRPVMEHLGDPVHVARELARSDSDFCELHLFFMRRSLLDEITPFAELCIAEDHDICLALRGRSERIVFEPRAVVTYVVDPAIDRFDRELFRFRWYSPLVERSIETLRERLPIEADYWTRKAAWVERHRRLVKPWFGPALELKRRVERERWGRWLLRRAERMRRA